MKKGIEWPQNEEATEKAVTEEMATEWRCHRKL
jgi:hypothetical protein